MTVNSHSVVGSPVSESDAQAEPPSRAKRIAKNSGWVVLGLFLLITFTIFKLPNEPIKNLIDGHISAALAQKGISYTANEGKISFFLGVTYKMKGITLVLPPPASPVKIDEVKVSPSILALIFGRQSGSLEINHAGGSLDSSVSMNGPKISVSFTSKKLDLGKLGILPIAAGIQGSGILNGNGSIEGNMNIPSTLGGHIELNLNQVVIDSQPIYGFTIPRIGISEVVTDITLAKAKATIKTFRVGKTGGSSDDLRGTLTGDCTLGKQWDSSVLNLQAKFSLSESILKSFALLDAILGRGKQPDGSYAFSLTGPISAPISNPIESGAPRGH